MIAVSMDRKKKLTKKTTINKLKKKKTKPTKHHIIVCKYFKGFSVTGKINLFSVKMKS